MLARMYRHVFASLLGVYARHSRPAHDEKGSVRLTSTPRPAGQPTGPATLKPGAVLVRGEPLPKNQAAGAARRRC